MDNVHCSGSESQITQCRHSDWGRHDCSHSDDVSISCIADSAEAVALVGGAGNRRVGRLEVFHANQWGTVCDQGFTDAAARVVCYSLGFGYVGRKMDMNQYGLGNGVIWLSNVNCSGTEQHIGKCSHGNWGNHSSCGHHQDVAVSCTNYMPVTPVRLAGGSNSTGRLEVLHNEVWGTVCGDFFTPEAVHVTCKMLGFELGSKIDNGKYRTNHGPIWLDDVRCSGTENDISECSHNGWGVHDCQHHEDIALSCAHVDIRLNGGRDPREGRLEVLYNGTWGSACIHHNNSHLGTPVALCNMLGFGNIGRRVRYDNYGSGPGRIWLISLQCSGMEASIVDCSHFYGWDTFWCSYENVRAAVSCLRDGAVTLVGGGSPREGRLEVYQNGTWGTVCDDGFTDAAAGVVCYSMGFGYTGQEMNIDTYGTGTGQIWLDDIECDGTERQIGECSHRGWGVHDCTHSEDVAISCTGDPTAITSSSLPVASSSSTSTVIYTMLTSSTTSLLVNLLSGTSLR